MPDWAIITFLIVCGCAFVGIGVVWHMTDPAVIARKRNKKKAK